MLVSCMLVNTRPVGSDGTSFQGVAGVSLAEEETIFTSMELFCSRVRSMIDIINTLGQFEKLCEATRDLPRLPRDVEEGGEEDGGQEPQGETPRDVSDTSFEEGEYNRSLN